jgi:phosphoribosylformylglycinamidine cyclo-ligase
MRVEPRTATSNRDRTPHESASMTANRSPVSTTAYRESGVDTDEADLGLRRLVKRITSSWPPRDSFGGVQLEIGYFANVIDIGGIGLAISTDGVGSKAIIAQLMNRYDTIGIDCVAMNVNDLICVGAQPISLVDYIAVERVDAQILEAIAIGLADGAAQAGISISGGEIAQLEDVVHGFDLAGTAVGTVPLDKILTGRHLEPGDQIIGIQSSGIHSNGLTLAREAFFKRPQPLALNYPILGSDASLGEELLHPTLIYVREVMEILRLVPNVKALVNITGDGLLNLNRVEHPSTGFFIDEMPETPEIFKMIQQYGDVSTAEMFEVYNMGVGFCVVASETDVGSVLSILERYHRKAWVIGKVIDDPTKGVYLPRQGLTGHKKRFRQE